MKTKISIDLKVEVNYSIDKGQKEIINPSDDAQEFIAPSIQINEAKVIEDIEEAVADYMNDNFDDYAN